MMDDDPAGTVLVHKGMTATMKMSDGPGYGEVIHHQENAMLCDGPTEAAVVAAATESEIPSSSSSSSSLSFNPLELDGFFRRAVEELAEEAPPRPRQPDLPMHKPRPPSYRVVKKKKRIMTKCRVHPTQSVMVVPLPTPANTPTGKNTQSRTAPRTPPTSNTTSSTSARQMHKEFGRKLYERLMGKMAAR